MTKEETIKIMAILKAAYPTYYKDQTQEEALVSVGVWQATLIEYDYKAVSEAVKQLIKTMKFAPSIAEIIEKIEYNRDMRFHKVLEEKTRTNFLGGNKIESSKINKTAGNFN